MSEAKQVGVKQSWSLKAFRDKYDKMKLTPPMTNSETGEVFTSTAFIKDGEITMVGFSSKLGELTAKQIKERVNELQVVLLESGSYKLCKKGNFEEWEDVDI